MNVLFSADEIAARIDALAEELAQDLPEHTLLAPILTGAFIFAADLARALARRGVDLAVDFLHLASYGDARTSSGNVRLVKDLKSDIRGRAILLIDDVFDSGRSLEFAHGHLNARGAELVKFCVLVDKQTGRSKKVTPDYVGFLAEPDAYLIGYGMDDAGKFRSLPHIAVAG